jgi:hypothetical protein
MQNDKIMEKWLNNSLKRKKYVFPSGKIGIILGYEPFAITDLLLLYTEDEIIIKTSDIPIFDYIENSINRKYYPDIFIPKDNLIIEVKSDWTFKKDYKKNLLKQQAVKDSGYKFEFWIYSKDASKIVL